MADALGIGGLLLLGGLAVWRASSVPSRARAALRSRVAVIDFWDVGFLAAGVAAAWWALSQHGVPAFRHDWNYGPTPESFAREIWAQADAWQSDGLGHPLAQAGFYPAYFAIGALGRVAGPHVAIVTVLALFPAAATYFARRAIRRIGSCRGERGGSARTRLRLRAGHL